jgi:hypothetical protein
VTMLVISGALSCRIGHTARRNALGGGIISLHLSQEVKIEPGLSGNRNLIPSIEAE